MSTQQDFIDQKSCHDNLKSYYKFSCHEHMILMFAMDVEKAPLTGSRRKVLILASIHSSSTAFSYKG